VFPVSTKPPYRVTVYDAGSNPARHHLVPSPLVETPLISCLMPTRGDTVPARFAIECFQRQTYPNRELVAVCRTSGSEVKRFIETLGDARISYFEAPDAETVGDLRNITIERSTGEYLATWDDDDLYHPDRLTLQFMVAEQYQADAVVLLREALWWPARRRFAYSRERRWENSLLAKRSDMPRYPSLAKSSDRAVTFELVKKARFAALNLPHLYVRTYHGRNIWDPAHFEGHFRKATVVCRPDDYQATLNGFGASVPILDYAEALATREVGEPTWQPD
jgi:glycosyltransferase involved in cell wall biosynthesis